jgi:hypothetical protein
MEAYFCSFSLVEEGKVPHLQDSLSSFSSTVSFTERKATLARPRESNNCIGNGKEKSSQNRNIWLIDSPHWLLLPSAPLFFENSKSGTAGWVSK